MTPRQRKFVEAYLSCPNASEAARRAGYSARSAYSTGERLLRNPEVRRLIDKGREAAWSRAVAEHQEVCERLTRIARADLGDLLDENGKVCLAGRDTYGLARLDRVESERSTVVRVQMADRLRALELLAKLMGYNAPERAENETTLTIKEPEGWGEGEYEPEPWEQQPN